MPANSERLSEGWTTPAAVNLSPVTRDYPSRALNEPFQAVALRLFYQGTDGLQACLHPRPASRLRQEATEPGDEASLNRSQLATAGTVPP